MGDFSRADRGKVAVALIREYQIVRQYKILISIMRDVTEREQTREQEMELKRQTVEVTDKVIDKQMRVVQEIASLLGETTAETKLALTKLKDAMQDGK